MTPKELEEDISSKLGSVGYFNKKLFEEDTQRYPRRSFDDLFRYYEKKYVTEKMLLQALMNLNIGALICPDIQKIVFAGNHIFKPGMGSFLAEQIGGYSPQIDESVTHSKYNVTYLNNLFTTLETT